MKTKEQLCAEYVEELAADPDAWKNWGVKLNNGEYEPLAGDLEATRLGCYVIRRRDDAPPPKQLPMRHEIDPFFTEARKEFVDTPSVSLLPLEMLVERPVPSETIYKDMLERLVAALDKTTWSSWQATYQFDGELNAARELVEIPRSET